MCIFSGSFCTFTYMFTVRIRCIVYFGNKNFIKPLYIEISIYLCILQYIWNKITSKSATVLKGVFIMPCETQHMTRTRVITNISYVTSSNVIQHVTETLEKVHIYRPIMQCNGKTLFKPSTSGPNSCRQPKSSLINGVINDCCLSWSTSCNGCLIGPLCSAAKVLLKSGMLGSHRLGAVMKAGDSWWNSTMVVRARWAVALNCRNLSWFAVFDLIKNMK